MSARARARSRTSLEAKGRALEELRALSQPLIGADAQGSLREVAERLDARSRRSIEHTVIGFFGATGSGKSSLINAVVGAEIATVAHRRPTTSRPLAAIVDAPDHDESLQEGAHELLDWLDIIDRRIVPSSAGEPGMVYVDLPDFDSVESSNRAVASRLAAMVDVLVWVTDPEKYADSVLHSEFISHFAAHDAVTLAVVNQADRLAIGEHEQVHDSFEQLLKRDGLSQVKVLLSSATTGEGVSALRKACVSVAKKKNSALDRLHADVRSAAEGLAQKVGATRDGARYTVRGMPEKVPPAALAKMEKTCAQAAQVPAIADAVRASYTRQASQHTGWPLTRWISKASADPLERLRIGGTGRAKRGKAAEEEFVSRSSLELDAPTSRARISRGIDQYAEDIAHAAPRPWPQRVHDVLTTHEDALPETLDYALTHTNLRGSGRSWFWTPLNIVQWLALVMAVAGILWLAGLAALDFFLIPRPPMPMVEGLWIPLPLPTVLIVAGIGLGIVLALLAGFLNRLVARRRRRAAEKALRAAIRNTLDETVVAEVRKECERAARIGQLLTGLVARG